MKMKKTWFSYCMWLLYAIGTGVMFAIYLSALSVELFKLGKYGTAFVIALGFASAIGIWFAGRKIVGFLTKKFSEDKHLLHMWECFLIMCITAGGILYRIYLMLHLSRAVESSTFYEMAVIKSTGRIPVLSHGASYLYTVLLSFVLSFTGNKVAAGVVLQVVFQLGALLLFYFALRSLCGRMEAIGGMAVLAFAPGFAEKIFCLSPESLYFLLWTGGLWLAGFCGRAVDRRPTVTYMAYVLMGIVPGTLSYLDIVGILLILPMAVAGIRRLPKDDTLKKKLGCTCLFMVSAVGTMLGWILLFSVLSKQPFYRGLESRWSGFLQGNVQRAVCLTAGKNPVFGMLMFFFCFLGVIGFWFHKKQKQDIWVLLFLLFALVSLNGMGEMDYGIWLTAIGSLLAGAGISSVMMEDEREKVSEIVVEDMDSREPEPEAEEEEKPAVKLIENPLPLPKKHVKKEMDYDRDIRNVKMEYDISVDEKDDFDI